jgi:hypothetical protein
VFFRDFLTHLLPKLRPFCTCCDQVATQGQVQLALLKTGPIYSQLLTHHGRHPRARARCARTGSQGLAASVLPHFFDYRALRLPFSCGLCAALALVCAQTMWFFLQAEKAAAALLSFNHKQHKGLHSNDPECQLQLVIAFNAIPKKPSKPLRMYGTRAPVRLLVMDREPTSRAPSHAATSARWCTRCSPTRTPRSASSPRTPRKSMRPCCKRRPSPTP